MSNTAILVSNIIASIAISIALVFTVLIWLRVKSPSRLLLVFAIGYALAVRLLVACLELDANVSWVETHRSIFILPSYVLLAAAFAITYHEIVTFNFDAPKDAEDRGALAAQDKEMKEMSVPMEDSNEK